MLNPKSCPVETTPAPARKGKGEDKGDDQNHALDEILRVIRRIHHRQTLQQDADEQRADGGAEGVRLGSPQHRVSDQRRGDRIEQQIVARGDVAASESGGEQNPADRGKDA